MKKIGRLGVKSTFAFEFVTNVGSVGVIDLFAGYSENPKKKKTDLNVFFVVFNLHHNYVNSVVISM